MSQRAPGLTPRGRLLMVTASVLLIAGASLGVWSLVACGMVVSSLLGAAYLSLFPAASAIWRRHVELAWSLRRGNAGGLVAGRAFPVEVVLRNRAPIDLGTVRVELVGPSSMLPPLALVDGVPLPPAIALGARCEIRLTAEARSPVAGFHCLHGASLELVDRLGVAMVRAWFPSTLPLRVLPRAFARARLPPLRTAGAPDARVGRHALRLRGLGGDLRELRDMRPGDPFRQIAWKATARTGRLMVRELDREARVGHYLVLDVAATMREGPVERSKLHHAVELVAAYTRAALAAGDRVGLVTFDRQVHHHLRPDDRAASWTRVADALMDAMSPVDAELTELTDGELVATVARYLRHQEGIEARVRRTVPIDDPMWARLATGPDGALYDLDILRATVDKQLARERRGHVVESVTSGGDLVWLRRFCRARGIELPYRRVAEPGRRMHALVAALETAARSRTPQRVLVVSDLRGLAGDVAVLGRAVALVRRRGHRLSCVLPSAVEYASVPTGDRADRAAEILGWEERRRERSARAHLERLGVTVAALGPRDSLAAVLSRLANRPR